MSCYYITSKDGYAVRVDEEDYFLYSKYVWRNKGTRPEGRDGILYRTIEKIASGSKDGRKRVRKEVQLHRLISNAKPGQSVHHRFGLNDCRKSSLVVYNSLEEHLAAEHPWRVKKAVLACGRLQRQQEEPETLKLPSFVLEYQMEYLGIQNEEGSLTTTR